MSRIIGVAVLGTALVACGPSYRKLNVAEIQAVAVVTDDPEQSFCAYAPVAVRALITYRNGTQARSRVPGEDSKGLLRTAEFEWAANHGTVDHDAVLRLPSDALAWFDEPISVSAKVIARPEMAGEAVVRPRFDCGGTLDLRGSPGARGGEAEHGGPGAPGPEVEVALGYLETERTGRLVLVRVQRNDEPAEHYLVAAVGARKPFVIDASGGAGGQGGQGIVGIDGRYGDAAKETRDAAACAAGVPGDPGFDGQPGTPGGPGSDGAPGGPGGRVHVRFDARFPELRDLIEVRVGGGAAGVAGMGGAGGLGGLGGLGSPACNGSDVSAGPRGVNGAQGASGTDGQPGDVGPPGEVDDAPVDVGTLFADELARGLPLVGVTS